jgi:hypothetical protein
MGEVFATGSSDAPYLTRRAGKLAAVNASIPDRPDSVKFVKLRDLSCDMSAIGSAVWIMISTNCQFQE